MRAPKLTEENLRNQIDVVKEEIRLNVLNRPYGGFPWILLPAVLFKTFANAHNGYGDFVDLESATVDDCAEFFDTYYSPANAVLTVAGDLDVETTKTLVEKHFGDVPARPRPERPSFAEPAPAGRGAARARRRAGPAARDRDRLPRAGPGHRHRRLPRPTSCSPACWPTATAPACSSAWCTARASSST